MAVVQPLSFTSTLVAVETLLSHTPRVNKSTVQCLINRLREDHYTTVSEVILRRMLEYYPHKITDELLYALTPAHTRKLDLSKTTKLTGLGIRKILRKCPNLTSLNLSEGPPVDYMDIFNCQNHTKKSPSHENTESCTLDSISGSVQNTTRKSVPGSIDVGNGLFLSTLLLSGSQTVDDCMVHRAIRFLPNLRCLHLSGCLKITDEVFLLDDKQRMYSFHQGKQESYWCCLSEVNISHCASLSPTSIGYLVSLCGPTLKVLDISATSISGLVLLFLCGYSIRTVVDMTDKLTEKIPESLQTDLPSSHTSDIISEVLDTEVNQLAENQNPEESCIPCSVQANSQCVSCSKSLCICTVCKNNAQSGVCTCGNVLYPSQLSTTIESDLTTEISKSDQASHTEILKSDQASHTEISKSDQASHTVFCDELIPIFTTVLRIPTDNFGATDSNPIPADHYSQCVSPLEHENVISSNPKQLKEKDNSSDLNSSSNLSHELELQSELTEELLDANPSKLLHGDDAAKTDNVASKTSCNHCCTTCGKSLNAAASKTSHLPGSSSIQYRQMYTPCLESLNISYIELHTHEYAQLCLQHLLINNSKLCNLSLSWKDIDDELLMNTIVKYGSQLTNLSMTDTLYLTTYSITELCDACPNLTSINLQGVGFIEDQGLTSLFSKGQASKLGLSETLITDDSLNLIAAKCADKLKYLDLSWCEELGEAGINRVIEECHNLRCLLLRQCPISELSLGLLADNCTNISQLLLPGVNCVDDRTLVTISLRLTHLEKLDISWNLGVTDVGMMALMTYSSTLKELEATGVKLITIKSFWLLVSDLQALMRCTMALKLERLKNQCGNQQSQVFSSDDDAEGEELVLPVRSTVYAPSLNFLRLEWCDLVNDDQLAEIISVCRGSLTIIDYYGSVIEPSLNIAQM